ncbi:hypothetical protein H4S03_001900 [Coemansia sp. S3946]|nr:hypothetical protein H4S03_001900 [Coemansia sp. S3946]
MLNKKRVFENRQLSLQSVCVYGFWTNRDNSDTSEMETNKFLDCLMAVPKRIKVPYLIVDKVRISAIKAGQVFNNITVFEVHQGSLSIFEMLSTLKALPALANFRGGISGLGPELESITADELPDYIASTYKMLEDFRDPELLYYMIYDGNEFVCKFKFRNPLNLTITDVIEAEGKYIDSTQRSAINGRYMVLQDQIIELNELFSNIDETCLYIIAIAASCNDSHTEVIKSLPNEELNAAATNVTGNTAPEHKK